MERAGSIGGAGMLAQPWGGMQQGGGGDGDGMHDAHDLDLALLHAAPLVWRQEKMIIPLIDMPGLALDFKAEVKALKDILNRTSRELRVRFDVARADSLGEVLASKPVALHLVCHADYLAQPQSSSSFFLGLENEKGELDVLQLVRLKLLLRTSVVRSTKLVFISACHSEPAAEAFVEAGVPHVVGVRSHVKVLDDAAALFARHFYHSLVEGHTVRESFEHGTA